MEARGILIGAHDLQIAATALSLDYAVATLNDKEFARVPGCGSCQWHGGERERCLQLSFANLPAAEPAVRIGGR